MKNCHESCKCDLCTYSNRDYYHRFKRRKKVESVTDNINIRHEQSIFNKNQLNSNLASFYSTEGYKFADNLKSLGNFNWTAVHYKGEKSLRGTGIFLATSAGKNFQRKFGKNHRSKTHSKQSKGKTIYEECCTTLDLFQASYHGRSFDELHQQINSKGWLKSLKHIRKLFLLSILKKIENERYNQMERGLLLWNQLYYLLKSIKEFSRCKEKSEPKLSPKFFETERRHMKVRTRSSMPCNCIKLKEMKKKTFEDVSEILNRLIGDSTKRLQPQTVTEVYPFQNISMDNPSKRLFTFSNWPLRTQVWPTQLSNAGFFYSGEGTKVQCFSCGVITSVETWQKGERPEVVHFQLNNNCEYIKGTYPNIKDEIKGDKMAPCETHRCDSDSRTEIRSPNMDQAENCRHYHRPLCNAIREMEITEQTEECLNSIEFNSACEKLSLHGAVGLPQPTTLCPTNTIYTDNGTVKPLTSPTMNTGVHQCVSDRNSSHVSCTSKQNVVPNETSGTQQSNINEARHACEQGSMYCPALQETDEKMCSLLLPSSALPNKNGRILNCFREPEKGLYIISNNKETLKQGVFNHYEVNVVRESNSSQSDRASIDRIYDTQRIALSASNSLQRNMLTDRTSIISGIYNSSVDMDQGAASSVYNGPRLSSYEPDFAYPDYKNLQKRLFSYRTWPSSAKQSPQLLAESGCFYTGENDVVRCFCCNLGLSEWTADDNPWHEHARHNPKCWFLRKEKGQEFIDSIQREWKKRYKPKNPAFDDMTSRLATFDGWRDDIEQTPQILADAGFFYTGETDVVRCHYCDGGLRNWEQGDIPWEEHARWFPTCKYLIKMKGCRYIEQIKVKYERQQATANNGSGQEEPNSGSEPLLSTSAARNVIEMGISINTVKSSINSFIKTYGHSNFTADELLELIFSPNTTQPTQRNVPQVVPQQSRPLPEERDPAKLRVINSELKNNLLCVICKTNEKSMLFTNCGHRVTCEQCCQSVDYCPHCDKKIKKVIKTFLS